MKTTDLSTFNYRGSSTILAEIESLKDKLRARFNEGQINEEQLVKVMRSLIRSEKNELEIENCTDIELRHKRLLKSHYAYIHALSSHRGKELARLRQEVNCVQNEN